MNTSVYAALDLGTNNCRLLIAVPQNGYFKVLRSHSKIVRLGEGLRRNGRLLDDAMQRTMQELKICKQLMDDMGVIFYHAVATEACRRAVNGGDFLACVRDTLGIDFTIISSQEEARLTVGGCHGLFDADVAHTIVIDIGGGSTELVHVTHDPDIPHVSVSIPEGVVTLSEQFNGRTLDARGFQEIIAYLMRWLEDFDATQHLSQIIKQEKISMIGVSGAVSTLGALHLGLTSYVRDRVDGMVIDCASIKSLNALLLQMSNESRARHPCIGAERADLIVVGGAVMEAIISLWPVERVRVADRGLRESILYSMMVEEDGVICGRAYAP